MNIDTAIQQLTEVKEHISDLNTFADMQTTKEDRKAILEQWAALTQKRVAIVNEFKNS